ncbi:MAG: hypothetical protein ACXWAS_08425 [Methylobacter sp.]
MEMFSEVINNSLFQAVVLGPIMGIVFGALLAGLTKSPSPDAPATVIRTKEIYVTRIIKRRGQRRKSSNDDAMPTFIALAIGLIFIIWKYAILVEEIQFYIATTLLTALSFSVTAVFISFLKGQFTSEEWWVYIISPVIILCACMFLLNLAHTSFDPKITQGALANTFFQFYTKWLSDYGRSFMIFHVLGVVILYAVILLTSLALLHYLSLMNQRSNGSMQNFWSFLVRITIFFSGRSWLVLTSVFLVLSYLAIEPTFLPMWVTK